MFAAPRLLRKARAASAFCGASLFAASGLANERDVAPDALAAPLSFRHDVLPILSKAGCNSGGCHGALAGKGEFRLSLDGYDPVTDHYNLTRESRGRRIEFAAPARSLMLTKPTAAVRHKGGKVLREDSADYQVLAEWIRQGAPGPTAEDPVLERIEVSPARAVLKKGDVRQLRIRAVFDDGSSKDVTRHARYASTDATIAEVDDETGQVTVLGHGEGAVSVWYSGQIVLARLTSPWPHEVPAKVYAEAPRRNLIDERSLDQLRRLRLKPSPPATDAEFIRRAYLDVIGALPTPEETEAFLADSSPDKRDALAEHLLQRPEFTDYWTYRWADLFLINGKKLRPQAVKAYYDWLRSNVEENRPWDDLVRQVVTARGDSLQNGATNFYAVHQDPESMAENVSQAFMSLSIGCAKCHNHPLEKWTNDQYYAFANLFARVRVKGWGGDARSGDGLRTLYVSSRGDLLQPRAGKPQPPAPLDAEPIPPDAPEDRRNVLADWLVSPDNPYFTRSIVNRVWAGFFGVGIVSPVDDLRVSNPASNEPLLRDLADFLVRNDYDLKALMRLILRSETYRRSSLALPENKDDRRHYSRHYPRRLMAEVLHDAIVSVTRQATPFENLTLTDGSTQKTEFYEKETRALRLYDSAVTSYFLKTFGRNEREITCECERSNKPSMTQTLHLSNGSALNDKLRAKESCVTPLLEKPDAELIERAYLLTLSRRPSLDESERLRKLFAQTPPEERRTAAEDLFWALMTSREFLFQH